jgi:hypothetical protein
LALLARHIALGLAHVVPTHTSVADQQHWLAYLDGIARRVRSLADVSVETIVLEDIDHATHRGEPCVVTSSRDIVIVEGRGRLTAAGRAGFVDIRT